MNASIVIPTLNGGEKFRQLTESIDQQTFVPKEVLIIDSGSTDQTIQIAQKNYFRIVSIDKRNFNHGATRQLGVNLLEDSDILIFLTQDVILVSNRTLSTLLTCFDDLDIGVAYGRQLPHKKAKPIEAHARLFNYPVSSCIKSIEDIPKLGIKTAFNSNSFAAYRRSKLLAVGGFPDNVILGEDTYVASKILLNGWKIAYCAEAEVYHSHNYNPFQEFSRYFDTGVFHAREPWIREKLGKAEGEGKRYVYSELKFLFKQNLLLISIALVRSILKYIGYRLGLIESKLPTKLKIFLSMNKKYWGK